VTVGDGKFLPLPLFGVIGFVLLYVASLLSRRATQALALLGGAAALGLLAVQAFVIGHWCWLCVTTDVAAVVAGVSAALLGPEVWEQELRLRLRPPAWAALGVIAFAAPLLWPRVKLSPPVPAGVRAFYVPGKINVVEFADFECPACRAFSGILKTALEPYGERVHFVRLNKPLDMHPFARDAARAAVCGTAQGKAEPMAEALFGAPDLSPAAIDELAARLGLDTAQFQKCMLDDATNARIDRESALLVAPEFEGLPTTYIGGKRLLGVQPLESVSDALELAARGAGETGVSGHVYAALVALTLLVVVRLGVRRPLT
jgi:predicted DsbA family dithiol-disulfide isomerase